MKRNLSRLSFRKTVCLFSFIFFTAFNSFAQPGAALRFDGTNDYITLPPVLGAASDFTIEFSINTGSTAINQRVFDFWNSPSAYIRFTPYAASGNPAFEITNTGIPFTVEALSPIPQGVWTHIAIVHFGNSYSLFINGNPGATGTTTIQPNDVGVTANNWIGRSDFGSPLF